VRGAVEPLDPDQLPEYADRAREALRIRPDADFDVFLRECGLENLRVIRDSRGALLAGAGFIASAQRVGGEWVPSALVTAVWAAPQARGRGVATTLIGELVAELRAAGFAMSTLAPANLALYRRAGYEVAAVKHHLTVPTERLPLRAPDGWTVEPLDGLSARAPGALAGVYDAALPHLGATATRRVPALWHALLSWNDGGRTTAVAARSPGGELRGTATLDTLHSDPTVRVRELVALEADAARTLLAHVAGYRGMFRDATWPGGPADPFAALLRDEPAQDRASPFMVRVLNVAAALEARGYPAGVTGDFGIEVTDGALPENGGRHTLRLDGSGRGRVEPGGDGRIRAGVRALAGLFTGHTTPHELALRGGLSGPAADLDGLAAAFAGPRPWLADRF
jgi:predicted acetyltransferase